MSRREPSAPGAARGWPAPAKLNLMLHVTGQRADGYHELQTVFQLVDLCDELFFETDASGQILRLEGPAEVPPEQDLVVRAALRLRQQAGVPAAGARIRVRKRIPMGGGLGGGSSDAATALVALNRLWHLGLKVDELAAIGLELGADVPIFVHGRNAWAEGVGERLTPLELPPRWFLILHPGVHVTTRDVFQAPELTRNSPLTTIRGFFDSGGRNDCEPVVRQRFPAVAEALAWLSRFAPARLTGTGSCIYASFERAADAERIAARVPDAWRSFVARGLDRSPLHVALDD
jgi:4-diphosphocytidyl-2-C-methyl-D-erythritol kinase